MKETRKPIPHTIAITDTAVKTMRRNRLTWELKPLAARATRSLTMMSLNSWLRKTHCGTFRELTPRDEGAEGIAPSPVPLALNGVLLKIRVAPAPAPDDMSADCTCGAATATSSTMTGLPPEK